MKLKLTELQRHQIKVALSNTSNVLSQIKLKSLKGAALTEMKILEETVQNLEYLDIYNQK